MISDIGVMASFEEEVRWLPLVAVVLGSPGPPSRSRLGRGRRFRLLALALLVGVSSAAGCERGMASEDTAMVTDSAGITVVESREPGWGEGEAWYLAAEPQVSIGVVEGPDEYQLHGARHALRLDDGTMAVANTGLHEIRFYDAERTHLRSWAAAARGRVSSAPSGPWRATARIPSWCGTWICGV